MSWPLALGTVKGRLMASNSSEVASLSRMYMSPGIKSLSTFQGEKESVCWVGVVPAPQAPVHTRHAVARGLDLPGAYGKAPSVLRVPGNKKGAAGKHFTRGAEERTCNKEVFKTTH